MKTSHTTARRSLLCLVCLLLWAAPLLGQDAERNPEARNKQQKQQDADKNKDKDADKGKHGKKEKHRHKDSPFGDVAADDLDQEDIEQVLEVLDEANPQMAQRLRDLRQQDEAEYREAVAEVASSRRIRWLMMQKRFDPEGFELRAAEYRLRHRMDNITDRLAATDDDSDEADELKQELRSLLSEAFEVRQQLREHELARLERRIDHLRSELKGKRERKEELIDRRYEKMIRHPEKDRHHRKRYKHKDRDDGKKKRSDKDRDDPNG